MATRGPESEPEYDDYYGCSDSSDSSDSRLPAIDQVDEIMKNVLDEKVTIDAFKHGIEESTLVRVMVVGYSGVGKSSLTRNLIAESQPENMLSTDGIDVITCTSSESSGLWTKHEGTAADFEEDRLARLVQKHNEQSHQTLFISDDSDYEEHNISKGTLRKVLDHTLKDKQRFVKIWDFGGQFVYYATHQLFHSRHAVYLLVLDASKKLDHDVVDADYPGQISIKTVKQYCEFWINSIQSYVGSKDGKEPEVILVATHTDDVKGGWDDTKETDFFKSVREIFDGTVLANHIQDKAFALSNIEFDSEKFQELRKYIMEVADKQQSRFEVWQPVCWIALETAIMKQIGQRHISLEDLSEINRKLEIPLKKQDQLIAFLKLHHSLGDLVYFDDDILSDTIVIDPQWIIDAFRSIIKSRRVYESNPSLCLKRKELVEEAKLSNDFIDFVWNEEETQDFMKNKNKLLRYMSKLRILSNTFEVNIENGLIQDGDFYIVPSLLHTEMPCNILDKVLKLGKKNTTSLVFKFDNKYVSQTLYHRITASALGLWKVVASNTTRLLFDNIGVYKLDSDHYGVIEMREESIEIWVISNGEIQTRHTDRLRRFVELVIHQEYNRLGVSPTKPYTKQEHTRYNIKNVTGEQSTSSGSISRQWQPLNATKLKFALEILENNEIGERILTVGVIFKFRLAFHTDNWQHLRRHLGQEDAQTEPPELGDLAEPRKQIVNMLTRWCKKEGKKATMIVLVKHIRTACLESHIGVDCDEINNIIDDEKQRYDTSGRKGLLLILNYTKNREGTQADVRKLRQFFENTLGFEIQDPRQDSQEDLTSEETKKHLKDACDTLNGNSTDKYYCFICVILSHGNMGHIQTNGGMLNIDKDIRMYFSNENMPKFAGRPKCFLVEACRKEVEDKIDASCRGKEKKQRERNVFKECCFKKQEKSDEEESDEEKSDEEDEPDVDKITIPDEADILMAYATTPGKFAFRNTSLGSWFINDCMEEFNKGWETRNVGDMLMTVRDRVADRTCNNKKIKQTKQMACVWTTMTKRLYLAKDSTKK